MTDSDLQITPLGDADIAEAGAVLDRSFGRSGMAQSLRLTRALQPESWICARTGGQIVGTVGAIDYGRFAYVGLMAVDPAAQGRGVGLRLMRAILDYLDRRRCPMALLDATPAGQRLYPKLGFEPDGETVRLLRTQAPPSLPSAPIWRGGRVVRLTEDALPVVAEADAPIFGADRSSVLRAYLAGSAAYSFAAYSPGGRLAGYIMANGSGHIGPWSAETPAAAEQLLRAVLPRLTIGQAFLTLPAENHAGLALLARHGFVEMGRVLHMRRGGAANPRCPANMYAQASLAVG